MSKLKRFNKSNKKNIMPLVALCSVVAVVSAAISYAVYQKEDEVLFINAKVGQFETSSSDIELAMTLDGEGVDVPPSKGDYIVTVECDHADGVWESTDDKWGAYIYNISSNRVKCNVNFETLETRPLSIVELGDYISMTPTSTSYTIPTSLTGYSSNQTINPSELNLWRVIRKNEDGTVEVVSEYVSSETITFSGKTGYMNLVGGLNTIAAQYTNEKYVSKIRHMGFSNQIEKCTTISLTACPSDEEYEADTNLVQSATETLVGKNSTNISTPYWLASRWNRGGASYGYYYYYERNITVDGSYSHFTLYESFSDGRGDNNRARQYALRPILTLKSNVIIISGDGKSASTAYQLS